jgi:hypothetical protein
MHLPDYHGGSIVNLMRSIEGALDARPCDAAAAYAELEGRTGLCRHDTALLPAPRGSGIISPWACTAVLARRRCMCR